MAVFLRWERPRVIFARFATSGGDGHQRGENEERIHETPYAFALPRRLQWSPPLHRRPAGLRHKIENRRARPARFEKPCSEALAVIRQKAPLPLGVPFPVGPS